MIIIEGHIEHFGDSLFIGWVENFKGLVVQGESIDEVKKELWTSLKVKIAYDYNLDISKIEGRKVTSIEDLRILEGGTEKDFKFQLM